MALVHIAMCMMPCLHVCGSRSEGRSDTIATQAQSIYMQHAVRTSTLGASAAAGAASAAGAGASVAALAAAAASMAAVCAATSAARSAERFSMPSPSTNLQYSKKFSS